MNHHAFSRISMGVVLLLISAGLANVAQGKPPTAKALAKPAAKAVAIPDDIPRVIPAPSETRRFQGTFVLTAATPIFYRGAAGKEAAELLASQLKQRKELTCKLVEGEPDNDAASFVRIGPSKTASPVSGPKSEGYTLQIATPGITLSADSPAGLYYGVQSLIQLIAANKAARADAIVLPSVKFTDQPRFGWRGVMLDESRHFFGKPQVKELLDLMGYLKLNRFHWHLTDEPGWRIEIKRYPKLTEIGATGTWSDPAAPRQFYTQDDIREIVAYAAARHIEVVPEIDMPGHATAACRAYPELSGGGVGFTFNPGKEETYTFLEDVLKEVAGLFPSPYLHLGGDEVSFGNKSWSSDATIVNFSKQHGLKNAAELEHYFMQRMAKAVQKLGKRPMGWDDVAAGLPPGDIALFWWHHERPKVLTQSLEKGYSVVLSPRHPCYFDFVQHDTHKEGRRWNGFNDLGRVYDFPEPALNGLIPAGKETNVLGLEACLWTERVQNRARLGYMIFPRVAAIAEAAWTPAAAKDKARFMQKIPGLLRELDRRQMPYFNPFHPDKTPEPLGPKKKAGGTANG